MRICTPPASQKIRELRNPASPAHRVPRRTGPQHLSAPEEYVYKEGVSPITDEYFWKGDAPPDEAVVKKAREKVAEELKYLAGELRGNYLAGDSPSAADFALYPFVAFCKRITFRKPESKLTEAVHPKIAEWAKRIESQPYFDKTYPPHWR